MSLIKYLFAVFVLTVAGIGATQAGIIIGTGGASGPTTLATDNFNRADNADLGTAWDPMTGEGSWSIVSNHAEPTSLLSDSSESNNSVTWPDDQYSQAKITTSGGSSGGGEGTGVAVRMSAVARTYYRAVVNAAATNNIEVGKVVAGTFTSLGFRSATWVSGDVLKMQIVGTTIKIFQNGTQLGADITDSSIASGRAGISYSSQAVTGSLEDWEGGAP